jgi:hypothetical protein
MERRTKLVAGEERRALGLAYIVGVWGGWGT